MSPATLKNIALQTNDQGEADAQIALVARRLVDVKGAVQINPDDLPASMQALGGGGAIPMWKKFRITLAQFLAGQLNANNYLYLPLIPDAIDVFVHDAAIRPVQSFAGTRASQVVVSVGRAAPGDEAIESIVRGPSFGDGPGIENNRAYINYAQDIGGCGPGWTNVFPAHLTGFAAPVSVRIYLQITTPSGLSDYTTGLTAGAVDVWLLMSKLPA